MIETSNHIENAKENYYKNEGEKLLDSSFGPKKYWSILNSFLTNKKMPTIPPLFENGESVVDYPTKAETFNNFLSQCLKRLYEWSVKWKMIFNPDPTK